jgi:hypothetical protein
LVSPGGAARVARVLSSSTAPPVPPPEPAPSLTPPETTIATRVMPVPRSLLLGRRSRAAAAVRAGRWAMGQQRQRWSRGLLLAYDDCARKHAVDQLFGAPLVAAIRRPVRLLSAGVTHPHVHVPAGPAQRHGLVVLLAVVGPHDPGRDRHRIVVCSGSRAPVSLRIFWPGDHAVDRCKRRSASEGSTAPVSASGPTGVSSRRFPAPRWSARRPGR